MVRTQALWCLALLTAGLWCWSMPAWAAASDLESGRAGLEMSQQLYCDLKGAFTSYTGLLVGLIIAIGGLWLVLKDRTGNGLVLIVVGALLTATPSLIESFLKGVGTALGGISAVGSDGIKPPSQCD